MVTKKPTFQMEFHVEGEKYPHWWGTCTGCAWRAGPFGLMLSSSVTKKLYADHECRKQT